MLLSAGLIGALFLSTLLLINVWGLDPIAAAAVLLVLPVMTAVTGRFGRQPESDAWRPAAERSRSPPGSRSWRCRATAR